MSSNRYHFEDHWDVPFPDRQRVGRSCRTGEISCLVGRRVPEHANDQQ